MMVKNNMTKLLKKVALSILLLVYSTFAFVQATFAWISIATQNTLEGMKMELASDSGIEVSLNGKDFYPNISGADLKKEVGNLVNLTHITSTDGINFSKDFFSPKVAVGNKDYITFTLWFRTTLPTTKYLFLIDNINDKVTYDEALIKNFDGTYVVSEGTTWVSTATFDNGDNIVKIGESGKYHASDAIRISFVEENVDKNLLNDEDLRKDLKVKIYDPSEDESRGYGVEIGSYNLMKTINGNVISLPTSKPNTVYSLSEFKNPYQAYNDSSLVSSFIEGKEINGVSYWYTKITINIWLEGWDADCFDAIFEDKVLIHLKFRGSNLVSNQIYKG